MNRVMTLLMVAAFATTASAQAPAPAADATPADAKAARQKAAPENLKSATSGTEKGYTRSAGEAANKAAGQKHTPKVAPDAASKRAATKAATGGTEKGYTRAAGEQASKAATDTTPKPEVPKPQAGTPELKKVVP